MEAEFLERSFMESLLTVVAPAVLAPTRANAANTTTANRFARFIAFSPAVIRCGGGNGCDPRASREMRRIVVMAGTKRSLCLWRLSPPCSGPGGPVSAARPGCGGARPAWQKPTERTDLEFERGVIIPF